ncbi:2-hydroxyacid dehydrogenase [Mycolicibacterium fluoranthenivorans]|uniref:Phosphoglycerate dehydrogenase n=1 Tax=Mycolicibacterium fluoranthenivorans TaxID=258505 RepID=A0A1G4VG05_9MYCO|nr:2-hydroxyacid dehydrogenase [Mycolicibacterium fluoranthenivorans]SCX06260.1 Phosphoglycerate dehydrogenase [Mycolicibacterium fluoranthenivorans]
MRVLVADRNLVPHRARFEAALPADVIVVWGDEQALRTAEVFVGGRFTAEMAAVAEKLRLIHVAGAGTDRVDFAALSPDTQVANTFHHERSIAEYVLSAAIMLRRDFLAQDRALRRQVWATPVYDDALPQLPTLGAARIGFVGFGHIGRRCWELLRALGCTGAAVTGTGRVDPAGGLDWAATTASLDRLMTESEVVVVSAPLTADTTGMIGSAQLRALGPEGVLINVGRGPLVDERSLYEALLHNKIRAAAIDVWYRYPAPGTGGGMPAELPFHELTNILMTPHSSGVTSDTFAGRADDIAANIGRLYRAEPLLNVVSQRAS